jgi:hypothetical protein
LTRQWVGDWGSESFGVVWKDEEAIGVLFVVSGSCMGEEDESEEALGSRFMTEGNKKVETRQVKTQLYDWQ